MMSVYDHMERGYSLLGATAVEDKLQEANEALGDLLRNKQRLEKDIKVKKNSLLIDQQKCMSMRRSFPYNVVATRYY